MKTLTRPQSSRTSIGSDPTPYRHLATGLRTTEPHFMGWTYDPRPEFTHRPVMPNAILAGFRNDWDAVSGFGDIDLGEFAEEVHARLLSISETPGELFALRVIERLAAILPRPIAEARAKCDAYKASRSAWASLA